MVSQVEFAFKRLLLPQFLEKVWVPFILHYGSIIFCCSYTTAISVSDWTMWKRWPEKYGHYDGLSAFIGSETLHQLYQKYDEAGNMLQTITFGGA